FWVLVGGERDEPGGIAFRAVFLAFGGAGFAADPDACDARGAAGAFHGVFSFREHALVKDVEAAAGDVQGVANDVFRENDGPFGAGDILRDDAVDETGLKDFSAVGESASDDGHLDGRHVHFALADADVGAVAGSPRANTFHSWEMAASFLCKTE